MNQDEIRKLFGSPGLRWIAERLRTRRQRGQPFTGALTLSEAKLEQRSALDSLLGRRPTRSGSLNVTIEALLEAIGIDDATQIVQACFGEVANLRARRDEQAESWARVVSDANDALAKDPTGLAWIESLGDGLLKRLSDGDPITGRELISTAIAAWKRMPFDQITLAELAADLTGDTHALDRGRPLSPLMLRGLKFQTSHDGAKSAEARRLAWDFVGVLVDRLSAPALTFNLQANPGTQVEGILRQFRDLNQPAFLTYQFLSTENAFLPPLPEMMRVFVVENPVVVDVAATRLGPRCAPLICTEGQPASAVKNLLQQLSAAGPEVHLHADFDWPGLKFVDQLLSIAGSQPWRMDRENYSAAVGTVHLTGRSFEPSWAGSLSAAMREKGTAVYEEQILPQLLADLEL